MLVPIVDFTTEGRRSRVPYHALSHGPYADLNHFKQLEVWLHSMMVSANEAAPSQQTRTQWTAAIQKLELTGANNDIDGWIQACSPGDIEDVIPPSDVENMSLEAESLSWDLESDYNYAKKIITETVIQGFDPVCAVCGARENSGCNCEAEYFESAVQVAEEAILGKQKSKLRYWVRNKCQRVMVDSFRYKKAIKDQWDEENLSSDSAQSKAEFNMMWRDTLRESLGFADYFCSLAELSWPSDDSVPKPSWGVEEDPLNRQEQGWEVIGDNGE